jgi:hypothetical protein
MINVTLLLYEPGRKPGLKNILIINHNNVFLHDVFEKDTYSIGNHCI